MALSRGRWPAVAAICLADLMTVGALIIPIAAGLARHLAEIRPEQATWSLEQGLSQVFLVAAMVSLVSQIVFGWLSDHTRTSRVGRLPFVLGGSIVGAVCLWQAGHADTLAGIVVWFGFTACGYAATFAGLLGTFADLLDARARSRASGWLAGVANGATAIPLATYALLPVSDVTSFGLFPVVAVVTAVVAAVAVFPYLRTVRAERTAGPDVRPSDELPGWRSQFWRLVIQRAFAQLAFVFAGIYTFLFLVRRTGMDPGADSTSQLVSAIAATADVLCMVTAVGAGYLAARTMNSLAPMRVGLVVMICGLVGAALATTPWTYLAAQVVIGLGAGAYLGCDLGLVYRVVPPRFAGRYLGFFNIARNLPQTIAPVVGPLFLAIGAGDRVGIDRSQNYTAFFLAGAVIAMLALVTMTGIRVRSADTDPERRPVGVSA